MTPEWEEVVHEVNIDRGSYKDVVRDIQTGGARDVRQKKVRARTPRDLIAGLLIVKFEMHARHSDAGTKFRHETPGTESGRLEDAIEDMKRGTVPETGIVGRSPLPGRCPTNAHLFVEEDVDAEIGKDATHLRRRIQGVVTKRIDLLTIGTGAGGANSEVRIHFLGTDLQPGR
jgi:hypothetical protein